jgi:hypothetical protein
MKNKSHLKSANENYFEHMGNALKYFLKLQYASIAVLIHAAYPQWHQNTASNIAKEIVVNVTDRHKKGKISAR